MSQSLDVSKGIDPVPVWGDIRNDEYYIRVDGKGYVFQTRLPFTTLKYRTKNGAHVSCVDSALVLKHAGKAAHIKDLKTIEDLGKFRASIVLEK